VFDQAVPPDRRPIRSRRKEIIERCVGRYPFIGVVKTISSLVDVTES
jgi:hypothetical protein